MCAARSCCARSGHVARNTAGQSARVPDRHGGLIAGALISIMAGVQDSHREDLIFNNMHHFIGHDVRRLDGSHAQDQE